MQAPFENAFISFVVQLRGLGFLGMEMCGKGSHTELLLGVEPSPCPVKHTHTHTNPSLILVLKLKCKGRQDSRVVIIPGKWNCHEGPCLQSRDWVDSYVFFHDLCARMDQVPKPLGP